MHDIQCIVIITVRTCPDLERCTLGCILCRDPDNGCPVCQCEETGKPAFMSEWPYMVPFTSMCSYTYKKILQDINHNMLLCVYIACNFIFRVYVPTIMRIVLIIVWPQCHDCAPLYYYYFSSYKL